MERRRIRIRRGELIDLEVVREDGSVVLLEAAGVVTLDLVGETPGVRMQGTVAAKPAGYEQVRGEERRTEVDGQGTWHESYMNGRVYSTDPATGDFTSHDDTVDAAAYYAWRTVEQERGKRARDREARDAEEHARKIREQRAREDRVRQQAEEQTRAAKEQALRDLQEFMRSYESGPSKRSPFGRSHPDPFSGFRVDFDGHFRQPFQDVFRNVQQGRPFSTPPPPPPPPQRPVTKTWRTTLGFPEGLTPTAEQAKAAYRRIAKTSHPDGGGSDAEFIALTSAWNEARRVLGIR